MFIDKYFNDEANKLFDDTLWLKIIISNINFCIMMSGNIKKNTNKLILFEDKISDIKKTNPTDTDILSYMLERNIDIIAGIKHERKAIKDILEAIAGRERMILKHSSNISLEINIALDNCRLLILEWNESKDDLYGFIKNLDKTEYPSDEIIYIIDSTIEKMLDNYKRIKEKYEVYSKL